MIDWMLYAVLVALLIAAGALAIERLAAAKGRPRRFVWLGALGLAVLVPLLGGRREPSPTQDLPAVATWESVALEPVAVPSDGRLLPALPNVPASRAAARTAGIVWGAGSAAALIALSAVLVVVTCARRRWPRRRVDGTDVYLSRRFGPALVGIVSPKPVIPSWVLVADPGVRAAVLRHEQEHARARDHLALLFAGLAVAALLWNPAIWWMCRRLRAAIEIDCDQRVVASGIGAADYGAVLLQTGSRSRGGWGLSPAMSQPTSILERRLRTMIEKTKRLNAAHGTLMAAAALLALGIACDLPAPTELDEAIEEVVADIRNTDDAGAGLHAAGPQPLVFVDGVRVDDPAQVAAGTWMQSVVPRGMLVIHVIKGSEATEAYGDEAAHGVIHVYTRNPEAEVGFTMTSDALRPGSKFPARVSGMPETITTNPGEYMIYESAQAVPRMRENGGGDDTVLAWARGLLDAAEVMQGAILFSEAGDVMGRISVMKDDEG